MKEAIGGVLSLGIGVAISPISIIAVVLMLATPRGRANGPAFVIGWIVGLSLVGTIVLLASSGAGASDDGEPATWVGWLKIALGALVLLVALRQWRGRHAEHATPKWMAAIDTFSPAKAAGMALLLSAINPKNLLLTLAAAAAIAQTGIDGGQQAIALAVFVLIGTLGPAAPVLVYFGSHRAPEILDRLKTWMAANNAVIMAVLMLVIGAKLVGDGLSGL
jgi:threonine/homoserine/homoserine lactone efflux protein